MTTPSIYLAEQLIASIKSLGAFGDTDAPGFQDTDLLTPINESIKILYSELLGLQENYSIKRERQVLTPGITRYRIPPRTYLNKLETIYYIDTNNKRRSLVPVARAHWDDYSGSTSGAPLFYDVEENDVVLIPDDGSFQGSIEWSYPMRPGTLVLSTECRVVIAVDYTMQSVALASDVPSSWTTSLVYDIHSRHSGAEMKIWDYATTTISGNDMVFAGPIDGSVFGTKAIVVGDYVCLAETCAIPPLPTDLHPLLVEQVVNRLHNTLGDSQQFQISGASLTELKNKHYKYLENRVTYSPMRIPLLGGPLSNRRRGF